MLPAPVDNRFRLAIDVDRIYSNAGVSPSDGFRDVWVMYGAAGMEGVSAEGAIREALQDARTLATR